MAKYRGVICCSGQTIYSEPFKSVLEAEEWINQNNNNLELKSRVEEVNEYNLPIDWYEYS